MYVYYTDPHLLFMSISSHSRLHFFVLPSPNPPTAAPPFRKKKKKSVLYSAYEKLCSMIICFWHQIISSYFCCNKFNISMFSHISHSFSKNYITYQHKKYFSKSFFAFCLRFVSISIYDFSRVFWLNLISMNFS